MRQFGDAYRGRRVLITGHTGFKGSWLSLWLRYLGADVVGVSLPPPTAPSHWNLLALEMPDYRIDLRDAAAILDLVERVRPELVFHLGAQSLVRESYREPVDTWAANVMGTVSVLDACRRVEGICGAVIVTSDKCYQNREQAIGYSETDALGGHDPYSASKAAAELVAASYRSSFLSRPGATLVATARGGNVVGGGDWSKDRLIPDLVRAVIARRNLEIRSPCATRPWQHVLESLSGYLLLGQRLLAGDASCAEAWNFGPASQSNCAVGDVLTRLRAHWSDLRWEVSSEQHPHEASLLYLDSAKAVSRLDWRQVWDLDTALAATATWYHDYMTAGRVQSRTQLEAFVETARARGLGWATA